MTTFNGPRYAFLNLALGGTGQAAGRHIAELANADGRLFPMISASIDTDPQTHAYFDRNIHIGLNGDQVRTILANPESFGPHVEAIVRHYPQFLNPEDISSGARTIRPLTQLAVGYHQERLLRELRAAVMDLLHIGGFEHIHLVLHSSSGGGTGSALQVLLPMLLKEPRFASRLTEGMPPGLIQTPILFVVEPFALALRNDAMHADKVLGNAYALRMETTIMEQRNAFKYCFHLGLANGRGSVLHTPEEAAKVLGTAVYQLERHWPTAKGRFVDTTDSHAITAKYTGRDIAEIRWQQVRGASRNGQVLSPDRVSGGN